MPTSLVLSSARLSLLVQLLTTGLTAGTLVLPLDSKSSTLREISILETSSQLIELAYYSLVVFRYGGILTWTRYLDWVVSTPVMLVSFMAFFLHVDAPGETDVASVFDATNGKATSAILVLNAAMLSCGFAVEYTTASGSATTSSRRGSGGGTSRDSDTGRQDALLLLLGTGFFVASFAVLFHHYVLHNADGGVAFPLYAVIFVVWGGYGVAATLDDVPKNVSYNLLDVLSKNAYGVFLFFYALSNATTES